MSKEELIKEAEELGIKVDKRTSNKKIKSMIDEQNEILNSLDEELGDYTESNNVIDGAEGIHATNVFTEETKVFSEEYLQEFCNEHKLDMKQVKTFINHPSVHVSGWKFKRK